MTICHHQLKRSNRVQIKARHVRPAGIALLRARMLPFEFAMCT